MKIKLQRLKDNGSATIGVLSIDGQMECFTVEDAAREIKIQDETCIPKGTYKIELRTEGGMTGRYAAQYPDHRGMLWLRDVPGFEWVYIHVGNSAASSSGCVLVNRAVDSKTMTGSYSAVAYVDVYKKIADEIEAGSIVTIEIV